MRDTHEYLADAETIAHFSDKKQYLNLLIHQHFIGKNLPFVTKFHQYSLLKKRVKMLTKSPSRKIAKFKIMLAVPVLFLCVFMTSCLKEYVEISERSEVASNNFAGAFPKEYEVEKSYQIRKMTSLDVNIEEDKYYIIRLFPANNYEGIKMRLIDEKGKEFMSNYYSEEGKDYFDRDLSFSLGSAKYKLEIVLPNGKKNVSLVVASRKRTFEEMNPKIDEEGFTQVKKYELNNPDATSYEYTVIFSAGTTYKITLEDENMKAKLVTENREETLVDFVATSNEKDKSFTISETGIYYLQMEKEGKEAKNAELAFKR